MKITIEETQNQDADIFFAGNVVVCNDIVVLVMGKGYDTEYFAGYCLAHDASKYIKVIDDDWHKDLFKQFHGRIVLES